MEALPLEASVTLIYTQQTNWITLYFDCSELSKWLDQKTDFVAGMLPVSDRIAEVECRVG